jgi:hypothetical protein
VIGDYFGAMRIPLLRGRLFLATDTRDAPPVVLVNAAMARRFWPGRGPIGERIKFGNGSRGDWATIVGVVGDVRSQSADAPTPLEVYRPNAQQRLVFMHYVIRARQRSRRCGGAAVRSLDQTVPIAPGSFAGKSRRAVDDATHDRARLRRLRGALGLFPAPSGSMAWSRTACGVARER